MLDYYLFFFTIFLFFLCEILHCYPLPIFPLVYFSYWFVRALYIEHTMSVSSINFPIVICHLILSQLLTDIQNVPLFFFLHCNSSNLLEFSFDNFPPTSLGHTLIFLNLRWKFSYFSSNFNVSALKLKSLINPELIYFLSGNIPFNLFPNAPSSL